MIILRACWLFGGRVGHPVILAGEISHTASVYDVGFFRPTINEMRKG